MINYLEDSEQSAWDFDVEEFLEETRNQEQQRLEEELERIDRQLEERDKIHEEAVRELESKLDWYKSRLEKLYKQSRGRQGKRGELKNQIQRFYRLLREEKQNRWRDRQELEQERRKLLRELAELDDKTVTELIGEL